MNQKEQILDEIWQRQRRETVATYNRLNQYAKKGQIVMAGSSLAQNFPINEMIQKYNKDVMIYNRGISGDVSSQLLETLNTCVLDLQPSKLFINIGSNDMNVSSFQEDELMNNYCQILDQVTNQLPNIQIYILSYYPVNESIECGMEPDIQAQMFTTRNNALIFKTNKRLKELALEYNATYIDVTTCLLDSTQSLRSSYTIEGIHLWPDAYEVVLQELLPYL